MAKKKLTFEEATDELTENKSVLAEKKEVLKAFKTENKIKKNKPIGDVKIEGKLEKLNLAVEKQRERVEASKELVKELKPRKDRVVKYDYPEGMDDKEKKKLRTKMRRDAKKAEKGETEVNTDETNTDEKEVETVNKKKKKIKKEKPQED